MTVSATPFALQNGSHSAALFRQAVSSLVPNTGGLVQAGDLPVTQTGTPSMGVIVGVGRAWVPGTNVANFSGTTYSAQAQYFALNDGPVTLTINAADPTNPRIDIVCLTVNDSQYSGATNNAVLQVITGTPAASPTAPTAPANSLVLANVAVAANATSIINANISAPASIAPWLGQGRHEEWTFSNPANTVPNGSGWGPGVGTLDTANSTYAGFGSTPSNDIFQVSTGGRYTFHWYTVLNGTGGAPVYMSFRNSSGSVTYTSHQWPSAFEHDISVTLNLAAGAQVKMVYVQTSGSTYGYSISHRLRVTKVA